MLPQALEQVALSKRSTIFGALLAQSFFGLFDEAV
jgi:hypothetical protein